MLKEEIIQQLKRSYGSFTSFLQSLSDGEFVFAPKDKWTAGQQADHILRSTKPLVLVLGLPKPLLRLIFGKANRPSRDYDSLVEKYHSKLLGGGRASGRFVPQPIRLEQRKELNEKILRAIESLCKKLETYSEEQLDHYILPHPLLGRLTIREMLYFTIYHAEHHQKNSEKARQSMPIPQL